MPTFVDIAGGPKGDGLKKRIEAGEYPGIVKTTLDGFDQRDYLEGKSEKSARDFFFYFSGATPSAVRYKNWKMYYTMSQPGPAGWIMPLVPFHFTLVQNIKRDPFEQAVGIDQKTARRARAAGGRTGKRRGKPMSGHVEDLQRLRALLVEQRRRLVRNLLKRVRPGEIHDLSASERAVLIELEQVLGAIDGWIEEEGRHEPGMRNDEGDAR